MVGPHHADSLHHHHHHTHHHHHHQHHLNNSVARSREQLLQDLLSSGQQMPPHLQSSSNNNNNSSSMYSPGATYPPPHPAAHTGHRTAYSASQPNTSGERTVGRFALPLISLFLRFSRFGLIFLLLYSHLFHSSGLFSLSDYVRSDPFPLSRPFISPFPRLLSQSPA